jgi:hypothetical protein
MSLHGRPPRTAPRSTGTVVEACGGAVLVGLAALGAFAQPESTTVVVPLAMLGAVITFRRHGGLSSPTGRRGWALLPAAMTALLVCGGGLGAVGVWALAGPASTSILTFLALAAAALWWTREQCAHGWLQVGGDQPGEPLTPTWHLETATTAQLRLRWRASYLRLDRTVDPTVRAHIAATRRDLLTEFERRDPAGFTKFLASRNPAVSYPFRFCRRGTQHGQLAPADDSRGPLTARSPDDGN